MLFFQGILTPAICPLATGLLDFGEDNFTRGICFSISVFVWGLFLMIIQSLTKTDNLVKDTESVIPSENKTSRKS